jgi:hypothetical protein
MNINTSININKTPSLELVDADNDTSNNTSIPKKYKQSEYIKGVTYNEYMLTYYHTKGKEKIECMFCKKISNKANLPRHQRSDQCQRQQGILFNF